MREAIEAAEIEMIAAKDRADQDYWRFSRCARGNPVPMCDSAKAYSEAREKYMSLVREERQRA